MAVLLGLNLLDPEAFIARRNLERAADGKAVDAAVLGGLSADAWPTIADRLPDLDERCDAVRAAVLEGTALRSPAEGWEAWNLARDRGTTALAAIRDPAICP